MRTIDLSLSYSEALKDLPLERDIEDPHEPIIETGWKNEPIAPAPYLPDTDLIRVVDLAIALGRPLLLQGEPGCGKTELARSVAYALGLPLEIAYVKSTSRAQDLLYQFDAVRRLYDSELGVDGPKDKDGEPLARSSASYVTLGPLGRAIKRSELGRRSVVLIDEIDKADLDFPNDLLWELDRMEFAVIEAPGMASKASAKLPIVIITHNEEKPLPPAFLRRCVYYFLDFPKDQAALEKILAEHDIHDEPLAKKAIKIILELRAKELNKKPGLTELIDWVGFEQAIDADPAELDALPNIEALLKDRTDQDRIRRDQTQARS
jgi:MoxR-like ATPase